jgi:polyhydroxyalkanoate synthesis regulator phasin
MADNRSNDEIMADLTQRARAISQDATSKVTTAMRDMIGGAAGIAGFAVESARDLVQYMVRRGQMTQDEADKLIREAEATHLKKPKAERDRIAAERLAADRRAAEKKAAMLAAETAPPVHRPVAPGRLLAQGAGKSVKGPADKAAESAKAGGLTKTAAPMKGAAPAKSVAPGKAEPSAKSAAPAKTSAAAKTSAPTKAAPAKSAAPAKASPAKAAVAKSAKAAPAKKAAAPAKKPAAKAPAKKAVKKRR